MAASRQPRSVPCGERSDDNISKPILSTIFVTILPPGAQASRNQTHPTAPRAKTVLCPRPAATLPVAPTSAQPPPPRFLLPGSFFRPPSSVRPSSVLPLLCSRFRAPASVLSLLCSRFRALASVLSLPCSRFRALASVLSLPCSRFRAPASVLPLPCSRARSHKATFHDTSLRAPRGTGPACGLAGPRSPLWPRYAQC